LDEDLRNLFDNLDDEKIRTKTVYEVMTKFESLIRENKLTQMEKMMLQDIFNKWIDSSWIEILIKTRS